MGLPISFPQRGKMQQNPLNCQSLRQANNIKFKRETKKSSLCDYSDAFILVTGNIKVNAANHAYVSFKNFAPFSTCKTVINIVFVDRAEHCNFTVQFD